MMTLVTFEALTKQNSINKVCNHFHMEFFPSLFGKVSLIAFSYILIITINVCFLLYLHFILAEMQHAICEATSN